ncbi:Uncharacterised protein [uncultured archaeon]|nr:Uncharacterised protein [uncultured archaeon]
MQASRLLGLVAIVAVLAILIYLLASSTGQGSIVISIPSTTSSISLSTSITLPTSTTSIVQNTTVQTSIAPTTVFQASNVTFIINNSQGPATIAPFQQMISFDPHSIPFPSLTTADLGNIRFYEGPSELYSWCESGCGVNSTAAVFWVRLPSGIPANSLTSVNLTRFSILANYDSYAGEAPQLSSSYGQHDNGANVFAFYDNFAERKLDTRTWSLTTNSIGAPALGGGLTIATNGLNATLGIATVESFDPLTYVYEAKGALTSLSQSSSVPQFIQILGSGTRQSITLCPKTSSVCLSNVIMELNATADIAPASAVYSNSTAASYHTYSLWATLYDTRAQIDYGSNVLNQGNYLPSAYGHLAMGITGKSGNASIAYYYARIRAQPPFGVMPVASQQ